MTESGETPADRRLRWYQRTWLWVVVAFVAVPLTLAWVILAAVLDLTGIIFGLVGLAISVLIPVGLWMGALTARSGWARGVLSITTIIVLFLAAWAVWNFLQGLEYDAQEACVMISTPEGDVVQLDSELCASLDDGSLETLQRTSWIMFAVFWVAPLFVLYILRKRFQPDDIGAGNAAHIAEVAGWLLLTLGGLALVGALFLPSFGVGEALWSALLVGVPTVSGVLLTRWGRRRRTPTSDHTAAG